MAKHLHFKWHNRFKFVVVALHDQSLNLTKTPQLVLQRVPLTPLSCLRIDEIVVPVDQDYRYSDLLVQNQLVIVSIDGHTFNTVLGGQLHQKVMIINHIVLHVSLPR